MTTSAASLIITVLNEEESIGRFLHSIGTQSTTPSEIVIVDGGSADATVSAIQSWAPPAGVAVTLIQSPGASISAGRNQAISAARHERLLITDAGTEVDNEWVAALLSAADVTGADVVSGFFYPTGTTWLQRVIAFTITPALAEIDPGGSCRQADPSPSPRTHGSTAAATRSGWTTARILSSTCGCGMRACGSPSNHARWCRGRRGLTFARSRSSITATHAATAKQDSGRGATQSATVRTAEGWRSSRSAA